MRKISYKNDNTDVRGSLEKADISLGYSIGNTGLKQSSGIILEEYQKELSGVRGVRVYKEMSESDDTVGAALFAVKMTIRSVPWEIVVPRENKGSTEYEDAATFVRSLMDDMDVSFEEFLAECLSMLVYGWSLFEIVLKRRMGVNFSNKRFRSKFNDGFVGIKTLGIRSQDSLDRWVFDEDQNVLGMWQYLQDTGKIVFIPMENCVLFRSDVSKNNPEGRSALRTAYRSYYFKKSIEMSEAIGIERELNGLPVIYLPDELLKSTTDTNKAVVNSYIQLIRDVRFNQQAGVILPGDPWRDGDKITNMRKVSFELVTANGTRAIDTTKVIDRHSRAIARSIMADWLMLGTGERGSQALSRDKSGNWLNALEGWLNIIASGWNRVILPYVWRANGWDLEYMPRMQYGKVDRENILELAESIERLASSGMRIFPDDDMEQHIRERAGFPDLNPEAEYVTPFDMIQEPSGESEEEE